MPSLCHSSEGFNKKNWVMDDLQKTNCKKVKRFRSAFTTEQVNYLEMQFRKFPYINNAHRKEVALALDIPERAVKIWFQNRRMKEKKEVGGKEFDDESSNRKSPEFAKYQLNNVGKLSVNDHRLYPLPLLSDSNKTNSNIMMTSSTSCSSKSGLLVADSGFKAYETRRRPSKATSPYLLPKHTITSSYSPDSAEFSVDLCKKYKNESRIHPKIMKSEIMDLDIKQRVEEKPIMYKLKEQTMPEDLSSPKVNVAAPSQLEVPNVMASNPGYISMVPTVSPIYAQPYYTANGVLFKPVSVVSTSPNTSLPPGLQESVQKRCCCDCHVNAFNIQQQSTTPQYIFTAVQLPNPSVTKY